MITHQEYMDRHQQQVVATGDGGPAHREYYAQFVTPVIRAAVQARFGLERLRAALALDPHLNTIGLQDWDHLGSFFIHRRRLHDQMAEAGDWMTQAGMVCILKEAARQVAEAGATCE